MMTSFQKQKYNQMQQKQQTQAPMQPMMPPGSPNLPPRPMMPPQGLLLPQPPPHMGPPPRLPQPPPHMGPPPSLMGPSSGQHPPMMGQPQRPAPSMQGRMSQPPLPPMGQPPLPPQSIISHQPPISQLPPISHQPPRPPSPNIPQPPPEMESELESQYDDPSYEEPPYNDAPYNDAPYNDAPYNDAPYNDAPYNDAPYNDGPYDDISYDDPPAPGTEESTQNSPRLDGDGIEYIYDLTQAGEVITGPGAISNSVAGILGGALTKLSSDLTDAVAKAKKYAMEQSIRMVLMKQTIAYQQQKNKTFQRHQVLVLMCRVYVGSISFELKEDTIRQSFLPFGPIKSINMSWDPVTQKHKGFAFVEYEIPEAAQLALEQMNGVMIGGRNIKVVGRPSNMPQAQNVIDEIQEEAKQYNRIYVASIHQDLTEEDIKSVFEAFGPIVYCKLAQGSTGNKHKGYGFIEYETAQAANEAIASMNLFDLGGQYLRVGRAITPPNALLGPSSGSNALPTAAAVAAAAATAKIQAMDAVASNVAALDEMFPGLSNLAQPAISTSPGLMTQMPGLVTPSISSMVGPPGLVPPPGLAIPHMLPNNMMQPAVVQPVLSGPVPIGAGGMPTSLPQVSNRTTVAHQQEAMKRAAEAQLKQQEELQKKLLDQNEPQTLQQQENMSIKGQNARHFVMQKLMRKVDSRVVVLKNMVGPEDVDETLQDEIQEECSKYGQVERVIIYNEQQSENDDNDVIVKIFVEFYETWEAEKARDALNGRYFGGRMVLAAIYDQTLFDHSEFSS